MYGLRTLAQQIAILPPAQFTALLIALRAERKLTPERPPHQRDLIDVMDDMADVIAQIRAVTFPPSSAPPHLQALEDD